MIPAKFIKSIVDADEILEDGKAQIAFIGRSNVGKSSIINTLTKQENLARMSSFPGRTQEINIFLMNKSFYLVDLPGYGFAKLSAEGRDRIKKLILWYLFDSGYQQKKIVFIVDANVGLTRHDEEMLLNLEEHKKDFVVVANKIDKIKNAVYQKKLLEIRKKVGHHKIILLAAEKGIGISDLAKEIFIQ